MNLRQLITTSTRHRSLGKSSGLTARILILCALAFTKLSAAPFTPGNLVIYRVGDGTSTLTNKGNPVFLDEYTPAGLLVQSIPMPTTPVGFQRRLVASGTGTSEGLLTRSENGRFLVATGYDASIPNLLNLPGSGANTIYRTIARVDTAGNVDTSTFLQDFASGGSPRSAVSSDGSSFWVTGSTGGIRYAPFGSTNTSTQLSNAQNSLRQAAIIDGQLLASSASAASGQIFSVGSGLPTTGGQSLTPLPGLPGSAVTYGFFLADLNQTVDGNDTLYLADEGAGLVKFSLINGQWESNGSIGLSGDNYRGLTGEVSSSGVTLHAVRGTQASGGGELVQLTDNSGYNEPLIGTPTVLASAASDTAFRGVAPAPFVGPDLIVELSAPETGTTGVPFDYVLTVRNIGNEAAGAFTSDFYFAGDFVVQAFSSSDGVADILEDPPFPSYATLELPSGLAPGASASLTITVTPSFSGTYIHFTEDAGVDRSNEVSEVNETNNQLPRNAQLVISSGGPVAPEITNQSYELGIEYNTSAELTVEASGTPAPTFQWYFGNSGDTSNPIANEVGDTLITPSLIESTSFWVRATNSAGTADSSTIYVAVALPPAPTIEVYDPITFSSYSNGDSIELGSESVGVQKSPLYFTISNFGDADLELGEILIGGTHAEDFDLDLSEVPSNLQPFEDVEIPIFFTPSGPGLRMATLSIESSDGENTPFILDLTGLGTNPIIFGQNALFNGDAEAGPGTTNGTVIPAPGWTGIGRATVFNYGSGGYPTAESPGPPDRGTNFFAGGNNNPSSSLTQTLGLSNVVGGIDSGSIGFTLSGYLGGFGGQDDNCTIAVEFLSASGNILSTSVIEEVTAADRNNVTGLLYRSLVGVVPATSRTARVTLNFTRFGGSSNDGYADNLSLVFFQPTAPAITAQPVGKLIVSGETSELTVEASGFPQPNFQWYEGVSGDTSNPITDAFLPTFTTPPLTVTTNYWVRVSNSAGTADSDTASIEVGPPPMPEIVVVNPTTSEPIFNGNTFDFGVVDSGTSGPSIEFSLTNSGFADLEIFDLYITGPHAEDFDTDLNGLNIILGPFEGIALPISFTPSGHGLRQATLVIESDDPFNSTFEINLAGLGFGPVVLGQNALLNGDAEAGAGGTGGGSVTPAPGWTSTASARAIQYGVSTFPTLASPGPETRGANFFGGGPNNSVSTLTQTVNLAAIRDQVVSGLIGFELSGFLGGWTDQNDSATITAEFLDEGGGTITSEVLGPVLAADRANVTGLLFRSIAGNVPTDADSIRVIQTFARISGTRNDGYSDNLELVFFIPTPPTITVEPADQAIASGGTTELSVVATGAPNPTYQWYAGESGDTSNPIPGATSATFTTPVLTGSASYWVRVSNPFGTVDSVTATVGINLIVNGSFEMPAIGGNLLSIYSPNSTTLVGWNVYQGDVEIIRPGYWPASEGLQSLDMSGVSAGGISQVANGLTPGATYRLSFDLSGNPYPSSDPVKNIAVSAGGTTTAFPFDITPYARPFGVQILEMGWETRSLTFVADAATALITFESQNPSSAGPALDNVKLVRTGDPLVMVSSNANLSGLTVSQGSLSPAFAPLAQNYQLDVPNSVPSITLTPSLADANALLKINGADFPSGIETTPFPLATGLNTITLLVTAEDGVTTRTYTIEVTRSEPLIVITDPATAITPSSAQLNATVNPRSSAIAFFEWGTSTSYGSITAGQTISGNSSVPFSTNLTGITGGTTYHYRIVVIGADGTVSGNDQTFVTGLELPVAVTGNPAAVTETTATLVGAVRSNGLPVEVRFEYGLTTLYGNTTTPQNFPAGTSLTDVLAPITGLISGASYHYRIVATSTAGTIFGNDVVFEATSGTSTGTGMPTSSPEVTTLGTAAIDTSSAELLGSVNPNGGTTVVQFEFGTTTSYGRVSAIQGVGNGNEAAAVSIPAQGLLPGTLYHYRLTATNSLGTSIGADATFTTSYPAPIVSTGAATALSTTAASVVGTVRARNTDAQIFVDYGTNSSNLSNSVTATPAIVSGNTVTPISALLPDLIQGTTYFYQVRAENSGGTGRGSIRSFDVGVLSGLFQQFPEDITATEHQGSLTVNLTPVAIGSGWRFSGEREWRSSGSSASGLASGDRVIEYRPAPGYVQPSNETAVVLSDASPLVIERAYAPTADTGSGSLTVTLKPESLAEASVPAMTRAQWRFFGETDLQWKDSGTTITDLVAGDYVIECKPVAGRTTPPAASASVTDGGTTSTTITYFITEDLVGASPAILSFETVETSEDRPYAYVGQITSDVGASTGFVVRPRVVATAGHVVFDDGTLTSATGLQWLFQRDRGVHEPAPKTPRGYYLLSGYAAQRALDNSPGTSTPESQNLDAAALYFSEDAGRSGFSGYLASDSTVNEFIVSSSLKTLVGYPVNGIAELDQGRMHATPLANVTFASAFGQTYTTSDIRSSGGNSGGPLCVQHINGIYYPAAIYLGGTAQTVVRAIDSDVVNLFGFAETSANTTAEDTGGNITQSGNSAIETPTLGAIKVNIEPAAARSAGAGWRIQSQADYSPSGAQIDGLSPNSYTVQFATIPGFVPPTSPSLTIQGGELTTITFTYEVIIPPPTITSPNTLTVTRGAPLLYQITATNSPTQYSQLGTLPTGTSFNATSGTISGTTQESGNHPVTIGATNSGGSDTRVITLTVKPVLASQSVTIPYLQAASYQIVSSESGDGVTYSANALPAGLSLNLSSGLITGTPTETGTFLVPISVSRNGASSSSVLTINITGSAPIITQHPPASKSVEYGVSTTLTVAASGLPEPTYQWYRGASGVTTDPVSGATSATFTTPPVTANTSYWARASSISGFADSSATAIEVQLSSNAKLSFLTTNSGGLSPAFNAGIADYSINVPYATTGITLTPTVQVSQSTVEIAGSPVASNSPSTIQALNVGGNLIPVVVTAGNGTSSLTYNVLVTRAQPPVVETTAASLITDTGATLNGTTIPNSPVGIIFQYGLTPSYGSSTSRQNLSGTSQTPVQAAIVGLTGNTTYHYRIVALTNAGDFFGEDMTFTTSLARPLAATGSPAGVSTSQATLIGAVNPRGQATDTYFEYGTSPLLGSVTPTQNIPAGSNVVDVLDTITGLTPGTTYHYRVVASSVAGISYGDIVSFPAISGGGSGDGIVDAAPTVTTGSAADITINSAVLQGVANPNDGTTFVFFEYGETDNYGSSTASEGIGNGTEPANVTLSAEGLIPGATYHYRLVASNSLGTTLGNDRTFTAGYFPPIASTGPATALNSTSATVTGTIQPLGDAAEVWFDYGTDGVNFPNSIRAIPQTVTGEQETMVSVDLTNLNGAQTYYYRARAESSGGTGLGDPLPLKVGALLGFEQQFTRPVPTGDFEGQLIVNLLPENTGGWRFAGETHWRPSGSLVSGMTSGEREIEFQPIPGYIQPQQELVGVVSGEPAVVLNRIYYESNVPGTGILRVLLEPASQAGLDIPVANRIQWRLAGSDDPSWLDSGAKISGLLGGSYLVECKAVPGKNTPTPANFRVTEEQTTTGYVTYFPTSAPLFNPPTIVSFSTASSSEDLPYAYVGQVRSGTGSHSGFVVKPRVVATAAQAVFDDSTLAVTTDTQWLLQRDRGTYEPVALTPRGFYIFTGYDSQRALEDTPGTLAIESQNLNVAALYFTEDAGRGGFSGFLASDEEDNEFLRSSDLKTLVGYPVNGIAAANQGRMHATRASSAGFTLAQGRTYTSPTIRGIGGMTGGPLCVRYQEGSYYPAGIYVGGTNLGIVRAIDSDVIDLFTRAETSANGGENNTGGGITHSSFASIGAPTQPSALQVIIEPAVARNAGAGWRLLPEPSFRPSGNQKSGLNAGTYRLEFIPVSGFDAPAQQSVTLEGGQFVQITYTYQSGNTAPTISEIADQNIGVNSSAGAIAFAIDDAELSASSLILRKNSSNTNLVPESNLVFGGSGSNRTITITPIANQLGTSMITVTVDDGNLIAERTFAFTVTGTALETWRYENFGTTANTGDAADDSDPDHDGSSNLDENTAGTNPNNGSDFFKVATITRDSGTCTLTASGKAGRSYSLERRDSLEAGPWVAVDSVGPLTSDEIITLSDPSATLNSSYYRLRVSAP